MRKIRPAVLSQIKKVVETRRLSRVVYMHADHFEPWRLRIDQRYADELVAFAHQAAKSEFARKLSLFYKPQVSYVFAEGSGAYQRLDDEPVVFADRNEIQKQIARQAMDELMRSGAHEIQLHVHHEGFTLSDVRHDPRVSDWLNAHSSPERDGRRLDLYLRLALQAVREDTGLPLERWGFVHGNWALNGSDHSICRIRNEIGILMRNGCFGDFTFPAGRPPVDPRLKHPFTCLPVSRDRGYDLPQASPRPVLPGADAFSPDRLFIWSSAITHWHCSVDYYDQVSRRTLNDRETAVLRLLCDSVHFDGTVYIKTHSHSMAKHYWDNLPMPIVPHLYPSVYALFGHLSDTCQKLGLTLEFGTAASIVDELAGKSTPTYRSAVPVPRLRSRPEILFSKDLPAWVRVRRATVVA